MADRIMRMPEASVQLETAGPLNNGSRGGDKEDENVIIQGEGQPLPASERAFFEPRFGHDFSSVRVHADGQAAHLAQAVNARAFTLGSDVFFGQSQYAPQSSEGRRLLAHELTHVVQQLDARPSGLRGSEPQNPSAQGAERARESVGRHAGASRLPVPMERPCLAGAFWGIQRKLLVSGKAHKDIRALLDLLEPASGFTLEHNPKTGEVSIVASVRRPPSQVLAGQLATIIDEPKQNAELNVGLRQEGVGFGKFPFSGPLIQEIDLDDIQRLEAKAPGSGVAFLIHEIVENFHAHSPALSDFSRTIVFAESHAEALEVESLVAGELVGPGRRVAHAWASIGSDVVREINDYERYFLVVDHRGNLLTDARQVSRVNVSTHTLAGFAKGSEVVPRTAQSMITAVAADLQAHPTATVRIEAGDTDPKLAQRRARAVQDAILQAGKGRKGFDLRSERNFHLVGFGLNDLGQASTRDLRVVIIVDQPDTAVEAQRGRLVKTTLSGRGQRRAPRKGR
ncbi:MAG: DUF4157 domain-containing protein [Desulfobacterales bacterium]|nr:MAG: DUF4157 domain-containing protein [Desulfobacterales bacterium]